MPWVRAPCTVLIKLPWKRCIDKDNYSTCIFLSIIVLTCSFYDTHACNREILLQLFFKWVISNWIESEEEVSGEEEEKLGSEDRTTSDESEEEEDEVKDEEVEDSAEEDNVNETDKEDSLEEEIDSEDDDDEEDEIVDDEVLEKEDIREDYVMKDCGMQILVIIELPVWKKMIPISSVGVSTSFRCDSLFVDPFVVHFETELSEDFVEGLTRKEKWERGEAKVHICFMVTN